LLRRHSELGPDLRIDEFHVSLERGGGLTFFGSLAFVAR
jgi:hypothetical protein